MGAGAIELTREPADLARKFASRRFGDRRTTANVLWRFVHHHVDLVGVGGGDEAIADGNWLALDLVALEEPLAAPSAQHRIELPGQIAGITDTGVHADAAGGCKQMRSVAREKNPPHSPLTRHRLVMVPVHGLQQVELEGLTHRKMQDGGRIELLGATRRVEKVVLIVPELIAIDRREDPKAARVEYEIKIGKT